MHFMQRTKCFFFAVHVMFGRYYSLIKSLHDIDHSHTDPGKSKGLSLAMRCNCNQNNIDDLVIIIHTLLFCICFYP